MFTTTDLRLAWRAFISGTGPPADPAALLALPAGAREVPLEWLFVVEEERQSHFDRDQDTVIENRIRVVRGWRPDPDPRIAYAGSIQLSTVDRVSFSVLGTFPYATAQAGGFRAMQANATDLNAVVLDYVGQLQAWEDLAISRTWEWGPTLGKSLKAIGVRFGALRGLELNNAKWTVETVVQLARMAVFSQLADLSLRHAMIPESGALLLAQRAGELLHVDLSDARLGPAFIRALASKLRRARRLVLSGNPIGDQGLRALIDAGALANVEDLWLNECDLTDAAVDAICETDPPNLRGLWLYGIRLTPSAQARLAVSPLLERLTGLWLSSPSITGPGALAGHPLEEAWRYTARRPGVGAFVFLGR